MGPVEPYFNFPLVTSLNINISDESEAFICNNACFMPLSSPLRGIFIATIAYKIVVAQICDAMRARLHVCCGSAKCLFRAFTWLRCVPA